uniref:Uncharacterized protein n=1 Tax=Salix viminalis TaxID=40686 RepID=A0A6N2LK52_SALVM
MALELGLCKDGTLIQNVNHKFTGEWGGGNSFFPNSFFFSSKANMESSAMQSSPRLGDHTRNALIRPFHKGVPRIEARKYISF